MKCKECGEEILDEVKFCPNCGAAVNTKTEETKAKKKEAKLSLIACVVSGVAFIFPLPVILSFPMIIVGLILGLIDLGDKDKTKAHTGSWFSIVVAVIEVIVIFIL